MSALVITLLRFGFLALIWLFIFFILLTIRNDVFGVRVKNRRSTTPPAAAKSPKPARVEIPRPANPTHLVVTQGPLSGTALPLGGHAITVGRAPDSSLVLDDGYASSHHARFFTSSGEWFVEDLDSTNGTFVGGQRVYGPARLDLGTTVTIGKTSMELRQ